VVLVSQVSSSAEKRLDKRPRLDDLPGSISSDADVVLLVYRDEVYYPDEEFRNIVEINIARCVFR
jgi:replicative DNA helicase